MAILVLFEDNLIYFPAKYPEGLWEIENLRAGEGEIIPGTEDCHFTASDGVPLHGWYCEPYEKRGGALVSVPAPAVLLWFHGNAGNVTHRHEMIRTLMRLPVRVFIIDYRGYGKSGGNPSEEGLYRDGYAAWEYLVLRRGISADRVILFGKSLGSAVAIDLATKVQPAGLIVQSGFTSIPDMAAAILPLIPRFLVRTKMESIRKIGDVRCPKLFIHSPADEIVPYELGWRLFSAASPPKQFHEVAGAPHNETLQVGGAAYLDTLRRFVQLCAGERTQSAT